MSSRFERYFLSWSAGGVLFPIRFDSKLLGLSSLKFISLSSSELLESFLLASLVDMFVSSFDVAAVRAGGNYPKFEPNAVVFYSILTFYSFIISFSHFCFFIASITKS